MDQKGDDVELNKQQGYVKDAIDQITDMKEQGNWMVREPIIQKLVEKYASEERLTRNGTPVDANNIRGAIQRAIQSAHPVVRQTDDENMPGLLMKQGTNRKEDESLFRFNETTRD